VTAPRTAGSPVLRSVLAAALENAECAEYSGHHTPDFADAILAALDREPVVGAFATALHDICEPDGDPTHYSGKWHEDDARALVSALFGDGS
jgi:hypothetical protein